MRRPEELGAAKRRCVIMEFLVCYVAPTGLEVYAGLLDRISPFSRNAVQAHLETTPGVSTVAQF